MYNQNGFLSLTEKELEEVVSMSSKKTVGKVLKRFEIHANIPVLKSEIRELLYESFRDLEDLIVASGKGYQHSSFKFKQSSKQQKSKGEGSTSA